MRYSRRLVAPSGFGQVLPSWMREFSGRVISTIFLSLRSVDALLGRDLGRIDAALVHRQHGVGVDRAVVERDLARLVDPGQRVLASVLVVAHGEVLAGVRAAAFL